VKFNESGWAICQLEISFSVIGIGCVFFVYHWFN
jgi:hypothetical protein